MHRNYRMGDHRYYAEREIMRDGNDAKELVTAEHLSQ